MTDFWWHGPWSTPWRGPRVVLVEDGAPAVGHPWWAALLFAVSSIALGIALVVWPALLAVLVASTLIATGTLVLPGALHAGWEAWKHRPRRIRVRYGR